MAALCIKFQPSGAEKTEFTPLKNESPSFSYQVVKKGLFIRKKKCLFFYDFQVVEEAGENDGKELKGKVVKFGWLDGVYVRFCREIEFDLATL